MQTAVCLEYQKSYEQLKTQKTWDTFTFVEEVKSPLYKDGSVCDSNCDSSEIKFFVCPFYNILYYYTSGCLNYENIKWKGRLNATILQRL